MSGRGKVLKLQKLNQNPRKLELRIQRIKNTMQIKNIKIDDLAYQVGITTWHLRTVLDHGANPSTQLVMALESVLGIELTMRKLGD